MEITVLNKQNEKRYDNENYSTTITKYFETDQKVFL